jgi:hypothetical protein
VRLLEFWGAESARQHCDILTLARWAASASHGVSPIDVEDGKHSGELPVVHSSNRDRMEPRAARRATLENRAATP